jgi:hypothetical protein
LPKLKVETLEQKTLNVPEDENLSREVCLYYTVKTKEIYGKRRFTDVLVLKDEIICYEPR